MKSKINDVKLDWKKISVDGIPYEYIVENTYDMDPREKLITIYQGNNRLCEETTGNLLAVKPKRIKEIIQNHFKVRFSNAWPNVEGWYWIKYKGNKYGTTICPAQFFIFSDSKVFASAKNETFISSPNHEPVDKSLRIGPRIPLP